MFSQASSPWERYGLVRWWHAPPSSAGPVRPDCPFFLLAGRQGSPSYAALGSRLTIVVTPRGPSPQIFFSVFHNHHSFRFWALSNTPEASACFDPVAGNRVRGGAATSSSSAACGVYVDILILLCSDPQNQNSPLCRGGRALRRLLAAVAYGSASADVACRR